MRTETPTATETAIYARISLDRHDGAGVARQLDDCRSLAVLKGWDASEFVDNDISASRFSDRPRPAYRAMLDAVRAGSIRRIVVWHTDRLYRQPRELEELLDLAEQERLQVVTVQAGSLDLNSTDGRLIARIMVSVAAQESDHKSDRVKRAKQQAREQGRPSGGRRAFGWLDSLTPDPEEAALIVAAADQILAGGSMMDIARDWTARGIQRPQAPRRPQSGPLPWQAETVSQILRNPRNAGLVAHRRRLATPNGRHARYERPVVLEGVTAAYPAIIDRERWTKLQAILDQRGAVGRVPRRRSLLTGFVRCGLCGAKMVRASGRANTAGEAHSWRCRTGAGGCGRLSIAAEPVEAIIVEAVLARLDSATLPQVEAEDSDFDELRTIEHEMAALVEALENGRLSVVAFERGAAALERRQGRAQQNVRARQRPAVLGRPSAVRTAWPDLTLDQRRAVLAEFVERVTINPGKRGYPRFDSSRIQTTWAA